MHKFRVGAGFATALLSTLLLSEFAMADKVMSQGDVKAACEKGGGESFELSASYGCILSGGEKAVFCKKSDSLCGVVSQVSPKVSRNFFSHFSEAAKK